MWSILSDNSRNYAMIAMVGFGGTVFRKHTILTLPAAQKRRIAATLPPVHCWEMLKGLFQSKRSFWKKHKPGNPWAINANEPSLLIDQNAKNSTFWPTSALKEFDPMYHRRVE
jgi:hypothetical protein